MDTNLPSYDTVFCDWLDVTYSPEAFDYDEFYLAISEVYPEVIEREHRNDGTRILGIGCGALHLKFSKRFIRVSASGGVLSALRSTGCYLAYLGLLTDWPHRVTRIDVSMDRAVSGSHVLSHLWRKYQEGLDIGQRSLKTSQIIALDDRKRSTGTFYAGYKSKATRTLKVYDKRWEYVSKHSLPILDRTRYEFTMKGGKSTSHAQPSLRDAALPDALFWDMATCLLKRPKGVPAWEDTSMAPWTFERPQSLTVYEKFMGLLETSPDVARLYGYIAELGAPAMQMMTHKILTGAALVGPQVPGQALKN